MSSGHFLISAGHDYALAFSCQELLGENEGDWDDVRLPAV
jgi:hypothetical protein